MVENAPEIASVLVIALFGTPELFADVDDAIDYVKTGNFPKEALHRFETFVRYEEDLRLEARGSKERVLEFLENRRRGLL